VSQGHFVSLIRFILPYKIINKKLFQFSALFLSERAPFNFPGFSILCIGIASVRTCIFINFCKIISYGNLYEL
jgi:hypothetical protein